MPRGTASEVLLTPREHGRSRGTRAVAPDPAMMLRACRKLAADMRREAAAGWPPILLQDGSSISRAEAAASMDRAGDAWAREIAP